MSRLNSFVDHIYLLNLARRTDRLEEVSKQLVLKNIKYTVFSAIDGQHILEDSYELENLKKFRHKVNHYELACSLSHKDIILNAILSNYKSICIFEDDVIFSENFELELNIALSSLPKDWELLYLGANNLGLLNHVQGNIYSTTNSLTTHAYMINSSVFNIITDSVLNDRYLLPVDNILQQIQARGKSYVVKPNIVFQVPGHSDIRGGYRNYDIVLKK